MDQKITEYSIFEIGSKLWKGKFIILGITIISILISFAIYNIQKVNSFWQAQVTVQVLDSTLERKYFEFSIFKENLIATLNSKGFNIVKDKVTFNTRKISQFGEITTKTKSELENQRKKLINVVNTYIENTISDIDVRINDISSIIKKIEDDIAKKNTSNILKLKKDLEFILGDKGNYYESPKFMEQLTGQLIKSLLAEADYRFLDNIKQERSDLEILLASLDGKVKKNRLVYISNLESVRLIKTSLKIYLIIGIFMGLVFSVLVLAIINNFKTKN